MNQLYNNQKIDNLLRIWSIPVEEALGDARGEEGAAHDVGQEEEHADGRADLQPHRAADHEVDAARPHLPDNQSRLNTNNGEVFNSLVSHLNLHFIVVFCHCWTLKNANQDPKWDGWITLQEELNN